VDFDVSGQPVTRYSAFVKHLRKMGIHLLHINFTIVYYSFSRKVLCNTLPEFCTTMKKIRFITVYLNETFSEA